MKDLLIRISEKKNFQKNIFKKIQIDFCENRFEDSSETLSGISVPHLEAVGHCLKSVIEHILVITLVLSYKLMDNEI